MAAIADTISAHLRAEDLLGVFDGADFVVIFSMADPKMAAAISDAIEKAIGRYQADGAGGGFPTGALWRASHHRRRIAGGYRGGGRDSVTQRPAQRASGAARH